MKEGVEKSVNKESPVEKGVKRRTYVKHDYSEFLNNEDMYECKLCNYVCKYASLMDTHVNLKKHIHATEMSNRFTNRT